MKNDAESVLGVSSQPDGEEPSATRLSKPFFLGSVAVAGGLSLILSIVGTIEALSNPGGFSHVLLWSLVPGFYQAVVTMVLFYKMWASIQDGHARTTPGKAIGFTFIPLFNIYWAFQMIWGFSKDYNAYVRRHALKVTPLPEGIFLTYVILCFTGFIPIIGMVLVVANYFVMLVVVSKICDAVNTLPSPISPLQNVTLAKGEAAAGESQSSASASADSFKRP